MVSSPTRSIKTPQSYEACKMFEARSGITDNVQIGLRIVIHIGLMDPAEHRSPQDASIKSRKHRTPPIDQIMGYVLTLFASRSLLNPVATCS